MSDMICRPCQEWLLAWITELEDMDSISEIRREIRFPWEPDLQGVDYETYKLCGTCNEFHCHAVRAVGGFIELKMDKLHPLTYYTQPEDEGDR